jgi:hypothetical protein
MTIRQLSSEHMGRSAMIGIIYTNVAFDLKHDDRCRFFTVLKSLSFAAASLGSS